MAGPLGLAGLWSPWLSLSWTFSGGDWFLPSLSFFCLWMVVQLVLAVWVGIDANRRGMNGFLWGLLVFFTCVVGLLVYLIVAQTTAPARAIAGGAPDPAALPEAKCGSCGAAVRPDFRVCPYCGAARGRDCPQCHRPVEPDWKYCSYCKANLQ